MNPQKLTFAVSVAVATTALLTATAALTCRARNTDTPATRVADVATVSPAQDLTPNTHSDPLEGEEAMKKVREAAREYVRETLPGSKADGVFALPFTRDGDLAWAGVDTKTAEGERTTIDVIVRRYVRKNGAVYYRAEGFGRGGRDALLTAMQQGRATGGAVD